MICRLCLNDQPEVMQIFGKKGMELNVVDVVAKHFWFEPRSDDPISTAICNSCWGSVSVFHEFYRNVEEAHRMVTERFSVNTRRTNERMPRTEMECKQEPISDEELDHQIDDILFNISRDSSPSPSGVVEDNSVEQRNGAGVSPSPSGVVEDNSVEQRIGAGVSPSTSGVVEDNSEERKKRRGRPQTKSNEINKNPEKKSMHKYCLRKRSDQHYVQLPEPTFECSVCKKEFKKDFGLKAHMALHNGDVLYPCPKCRKIFNSLADLHAHSKKGH